MTSYCFEDKTQNSNRPLGLPKMLFLLDSLTLPLTFLSLIFCTLIIVFSLALSMPCTLSFQHPWTCCLLCFFVCPPFSPLFCYFFKSQLNHLFIREIFPGFSEAGSFVLRLHRIVVFSFWVLIWALNDQSTSVTMWWMFSLSLSSMRTGTMSDFAHHHIDSMQHNALNVVDLQ